MNTRRKTYIHYRSKRSLSLLFLFLLSVICIWLYGLFVFVEKIPHKTANIDHASDAIVVLTGGSERLKQGLRLLIEKKAKKLFVSGVYRGNDVRRLLTIQKQNPTEVLCCISLGYNAVSTAGNAIETANWIKKHGYKSLNLVTANYHMPRSLMLFQHSMPNIEIIPHPVFPAKFKRDNWWLWPGTASLIISEYTKYCLSLFRKKLPHMLNSLSISASK